MLVTTGAADTDPVVIGGGDMLVAIAITRYVAERRRRGEFADDTVSMVRYVLRAMSNAIGGAELEVRKVTHRRLRRWWAELEGSPSTVRCRLSTVRVFYRWCIDEGLLARDPTVGFKSPREPERVPRVFTPGQVTRLLNATDCPRLAAIIMLMVHCGLREGEVSRVRVEDIDVADRLVLVRGKGRRERVVPVPVEAWQAVETYLTVYPASSGPLIRSKLDPNRPLHPKTIGSYVRQVAKAAGVKVRPLDGLSAHGLRRTCASDVLDGGANIRQVQALLGHSYLSSTERYLRKSNARDLRPVVEGRTYIGAAAS